MKKHFIPFSFFLMITFLIAGNGWAQAKQETHAPIIMHAYAADKGPYGINWKIFIEAEDAGADMDYVIVTLDRIGQGIYPPDHILIDPQHRNHLKGFLQWDTFSSTGAVLEEGTGLP